MHLHKLLISSSKIAIVLLIVFIAVIVAYVYLKKTVCLTNECYSLPKGWIVEYQVKKNHASFLGLDFFTSFNKDIDNILFLRSSISTVSLSQDIPDISEKNLKEAGFTHIKYNNCSYYFSSNSKEQYSHLIFRKKRIGVFIYDTNEDALKEITTMLCNPTDSQVPLYWFPRSPW